MILVIDTQYMENYGAHAWDGEGECPQYWKMKGGSSYKITNCPGNVDLDVIVDMVRGDIERSNDYCREYILGVHVEHDGWLSDFERSQQEYEGEITYPEPEFDYLDLRMIEVNTYADSAADQDAVYYGS
jgi:hypothetical protein